jgi:hypothetical protein
MTEASTDPFGLIDFCTCGLDAAWRRALTLARSKARGRSPSGPRGRATQAFPRALGGRVGDRLLQFGVTPGTAAVLGRARALTARHTGIAAARPSTPGGRTFSSLLT